MSTISLTKLKRRPAKQWKQKKEHLVVTSKGRPRAVLLPIDGESVEPTLSILRSVRALQAQAALQKAASQNGTASLTMAQIDAEIAAARRARRKK